MAFKKIIDSDLINKGVTGLPDVPGLSTSEMQAKFDELSRDLVIPKINELVDGLNGEEVGQSSKIENPITKEKEVIQTVVNAIYDIVKLNADDRHTHENKETLNKITETLYASITSLLTMFSGITSVNTSVLNSQTQIPTSSAIVDYVQKLGAGDMLAAVYDQNDNGVVDDSEKLGGISAVDYPTKAEVINSYSDLMAATLLDNYLAGAKAVKEGFTDVNSKLGNFLVTYSFLSGIGDDWVQDSQYPERYYKTYEIPEKEGYKFFFAYYEIAWTSGNVYGNYLLKNQFLYDKTGRIEVYSNTGNPNFVPGFICVYLPL